MASWQRNVPKRMGKPDPKQPCQARHYRRKGDICGKPSDTTRKVQAAPGLWVHVRLCHHHQHVWDEAQEWGGAEPIREKPCGPTSACREGLIPASACKDPFPFSLGLDFIEQHLLWKGYHSGNTLIRQDREPHLEKALKLLDKRPLDRNLQRLAFVMGWDACELEKKHDI